RGPSPPCGAAPRAGRVRPRGSICRPFRPRSLRMRPALQLALLLPAQVEQYVDIEGLAVARLERAVVLHDRGDLLHARALLAGERGIEHLCLDGRGDDLLARNFL